MDSLQEAAMLGKVFDRFVEKSPISVSNSRKASNPSNDADIAVGFS